MNGRQKPESFRAVAVAAAIALAACGASETDPDAAKLVINELVAANAGGCKDEAGEFDDWLELYNPGTAPVSLEGYTITDDRTAPLKHRFDASLSVPAGGYLLIWADGAPEQGLTHLPFKLSALGEELVLLDAAGQVVAEHTWTAVADDVALARFPDGTGPFVACAAATCGAANGAACPP